MSNDNKTNIKDGVNPSPVSRTSQSENLPPRK